MKKQVYLATLGILLCSAASSFANDGEKGADKKATTTMTEYITKLRSDCKNFFGNRYVQVGVVAVGVTALVAGGYYLYNKINAQKSNETLV